MKKHQAKQEIYSCQLAKAENQASHLSIIQTYKDKVPQRQLLDDGKLLQGKFETVQKVEFEEEEPLQGKFEAKQLATFQDAEYFQLKPNNTGLPDHLKNGIENLSGYSMDDVKVHYNSPEPATLQAHAYAQGTNIHIGPGQEKHLPHEAWHVVQQKQGRVKPTMQMRGKVNVNDDERLEKEADIMGMNAQTIHQTKAISNSSSTSLSSDLNNSYATHQRVRFSNLNSFYREPITSGKLSAGLAKELMKHYTGNNDSQFMISLSPKNKAWVAKHASMPGSQDLVGDLIWVEILQNDWAIISQKAEMASLKSLAKPKVEQLSEEDFELQSHIMELLNTKVTEMDEKERKQVYRLGTVEVDFIDGHIVLNLTAPLLVVPNGLAYGYNLIDDNEFLKNSIKQNIQHTLEQSGQLDYIKRNELVDENWRVIVDVDFYYERPSDAVGFHKDTIGRSLFVNLNFNNPENELVGPEYILNPIPVSEHDEHIKNKLPIEFIEDLIRERERLPLPQQIEATKIPKRGRVSFVDEMIHHTTPYTEHRGVSNIQLDTYIRNSGEGDLYKRVRTAYLFTTLVNKVSHALVSIEYLKEIELADQDIKLLCPNGELTSSQAMKSVVEKQKNYIDMQDLLLKYPKIVNIIKLCRSTTHYEKQELINVGLDESFVNELFIHYKKPNMSSVSLAGCEEHCDHDVNSKSYPIMASHQRKLTRRMSEMILMHQLPLATNKKRQFFRTWVQVIPRN